MNALIAEALRQFGVVFATIAALLTTAPLAAQASVPKVSAFGQYAGYSPVLYTETIHTSHYFRTSDGTRLAMDIHRPAVNGKAMDTPYPVIWQHSFSRRAAVDQGASATSQIPTLVKYGYVVALVDRRGMGASFGTRRGYHDRNEARDAYEINEWLAKQPWSTGKVGVYGCSNTGDAALHVATLTPPSLKAIVAGCFSWSKYDGFLRGGIRANWGSGTERSAEEDMKNPPVDGDDDRSLLRQAVNEHRGNTPLVAMWKSMPYRDSWSDIVGSRFWLEGSAATYRDQIERSGAAIYITGGWLDDFRREGLVAYASLANPKKIVIGPWAHCRNEDLDLLTESLRFFDYWLKGIDNGIMREPPIHYYTQGAGADVAWKGVRQWPPQTTSQPMNLLRGSGAQDHVLGATAFSKQATGIDLPVREPITCPGQQSSQTQTCLQDGNGLRFTSDVLTADREVTGHPLAQLWIASTAADQNVFVYLEDVAPDGTVRVITDGRLKASLRTTHRPPYDFLGLPWHRGLESDVLPLSKGEAVKLSFDLLPLSYVFKTGHRMRVTVTGSDPRERDARATNVVLTVFSDADRPSTISLPFMSRSP